ncbi:hypothetical protein FOA52_003771 [Chlamydomonas sp. UWO 241]|nr:hypothetical protein FOA52_003771 [Chlamydomonas sp. UWO 241]
MARARAAPARASAPAAARPRPAASSGSSTPPAAGGGGWFSSPVKAGGAAPPAPHAAAPPPAPMAQGGGGGGGMMSGLMGSVVSGMAMGTGSAVAHRAVDSMMGPREVNHVHQEAPGAPAAPAAAAPMMSNGANPCEERVREFGDCMSRANGDMASCQFYFDSMNQCKTSHRQA